MAKHFVNVLGALQRITDAKLLECEEEGRRHRCVYHDGYINTCSDAFIRSYLSLSIPMSYVIFVNSFRKGGNYAVESIVRFLAASTGPLDEPVLGVLGLLKFMHTPSSEYH
jgi:hypothetical protein